MLGHHVLVDGLLHHDYLAHEPAEVDVAGAGKTEVQLGIPSWDWSIFSERWTFVTSELLPRYTYQAKHDRAALNRQLTTPYEQLWNQSRPLYNIPRILASTVNATKVKPAG